MDSSILLDLRPGVRPDNPGGRHSQVGSLAGAAHLLKDNAGVLR